MPCLGTTIGPDILCDILYEYVSWFALSDNTVEFNCPLVIGTVALASSVRPVQLDEIYTLFLHVWIEVIEPDKKVYTWIWYRHLWV
jgi:hypothetical protein